MSLNCPFCGQDNVDHARFCRHCGKPLTQKCPSCGQSASLGARFCSHCSHPLTSAGVNTPSPVVPALTGRLTPGAILAGRYYIVRLLGKGGMGAVYLAGDRRISGQQWAIKEMSDQAISDPIERQAAIDAFNKEAELLARLEHPNLPKVVDRFSEYSNQFLVMEYVPGQTLERRLETARGPLPQAEVRNYVEQLCDVLAYLHDQRPPIIFRDLKPANIIARPDGRLKLIDFGIARHFKPGKAKDTQAMGTPGYAAPEQYGKGQSDARADIYALGATMHHMLTGRDPSQEPFKFPPVRALNNRVPPPMEMVVMRAVQMDVSQRWKSVRDLQAAMTQPLSAPAAATTPVTAPAPQKIPAAFVATPIPPAPTKTGQPPIRRDIRRAGIGWFSVVAVGIGVFLASPLYQTAFDEALRTFAFPLLENEGVRWGLNLAILLLAYLLTHRPGAILLAAATASLAALSIFDSYWLFVEQTLLCAIPLEFVLGLTVWRTRHLGLLLLAGAAAVAASLALLYAWTIDTQTILYLSVTFLVTLVINLFISAGVNTITGVGR